MNRERAETHLRLLAEAELRRAMKMPVGSISGQWNSAMLAQALSGAGAMRADVAEKIQADIRLAIAVRLDVGVAARRRLAGPDLGPRRTRPASQRASWRVVPVGQVLKIPDDLHRDLFVVAYVQSAADARFIVAGQPFRPLSAADDRGVSYQIGWSGGHAAGELLLRPDPPHQIRWLDLTMAATEPATRIELDPQITVPDVTVTRKAHSPGELLLDVIAARILAIMAPFSEHNPGQLTAARASLRTFIADGSGHMVAALHAAGLLPPDSPAPGYLAGLCARLGINGHGITAPPAGDLPERWQSMLTPATRSEPQPPPAPDITAAAVAELPELDGAKIAVVGLHHGERGTIMHLLASGTALQDDWAYANGVRPLPVLWIRDSDGRWHATCADGVMPWGNTGVVKVFLRIVPPLDRGTAWIDIAATGRSAEVRATLPLSGVRTVDVTVGHSRI